MTELNPYVAPTATLDHEFDVDDIELAGLGERFFARLIDWALRSIIVVILFVVFFGGLIEMFRVSWGPDWLERVVTNPYEVLWYVFVNFNNPLILYFLILTHLSFVILQAIPLAIWGQTIGKKCLSVAMVNAKTYEKVSFFKLLFWRYMVWDIPALFFGPLNWLIRLTDLFYGFQTDRRTLHDKLAGTVVIKV